MKIPQFSLRQLMVAITLFAVMLGEALLIIQFRRERNELRNELSYEKFRQANLLTNYEQELKWRASDQRRIQQLTEQIHEQSP